MKTFFLWGGGLIVLWLIFRKVFGNKTDEDTSLELMLDVSQKFQMTQSQFEKASNCSLDIKYLIEGGFDVIENTPHKIILALKKENYNCEYRNYYELEGKKVKKVISELVGEWEVGKKTKNINGGTNDAYQKWLDFDAEYEEALEQ